MRPTYLLAALLLTAAGCTSDESPASDTTAVAAGAEAEAGASERAVSAARVADAIARSPDAADSILSAAGHTPESWERLMYDIAADSAEAAAYAAARAP